MRSAGSLATTLLVLGGLALGGCGQSAEEKAQNDVCDARSDIQTQLQKLQTLTITTASIDTIQQSLGAIGDDLKTIKNAQGDLSGQRKQDVEDAAQTFSSQLSGIASDLVAGLSSGQARSRVQSAFRQLGASFRRAFAPVDCG